MQESRTLGFGRLFRQRRLLALVSSAAAYLPILAGIIEPMIWPLLYASPLLYHMLYWWWEPLAQHLFPVWWLFTSYIRGTGWTRLLAPFVIGVGAVILLIGLAQVARSVARGSRLVTSGLYRYVRHPQHLGIAILSFGLLMLNGYGIRVGDLYAWTLVAFIYVLLAESEEADLEEEFREAYLRYKMSVPYMLPLLPSTHGRIPKILPSRGLKRKLALTTAYVLVLIVFTLLLRLVPLYHTR
jgi:protein-S-isoprenylcysteine O-methyltransferase Ste14